MAEVLRSHSKPNVTATARKRRIRQLLTMKSTEADEDERAANATGQTTLHLHTLCSLRSPRFPAIFWKLVVSRISARRRSGWNRSPMAGSVAASLTPTTTEYQSTAVVTGAADAAVRCLHPISVRLRRQVAGTGFSVTSAPSHAVSAAVERETFAGFPDSLAPIVRPAADFQTARLSKTLFKCACAYVVCTSASEACVITARSCPEQQIRSPTEIRLICMMNQQPAVSQPEPSALKRLRVAASAPCLLSVPWGLIFVILLVGLLPAPNEARTVAKRSIIDTGCRGNYVPVFEKYFERLERICKECYDLYREPSIRGRCS
ncbi:prepro ion transport peptide [Tropilaelaps mercedesae]|uniref:Prepro ion transport peptide n=1 Tax=Tropilaelaps mercedesae TaxID=418985 RepID=A0A1V9XQM2_9ACAR|nr:prepro ion transport peptide [Tropilaelaps mercedesae]